MAGQTKSRPSVPHGAFAPTYRRGVRNEKAARRDAQAAAFEALPEAQKAQRKQAHRDYLDDMAIWRKEFDEFGPEEASRRLAHRRDQRRALAKLVDREARIAIEGDTAMDDVPFGEKGE